MIKIGVVITTYNRQNLLCRAIDSILNQSYQKFIICVIEDCSPDDTSVIMNIKYAHQKKIKYIRLSKNSGVNVARNTGIEYLTSKDVNCDYVTFLDDDDYFISNTLNEANHQISLTNTNWLLFNKIYPSGEKITKVTNYGYLSYLYDYFTYARVSGDSTMFISKFIIGKDRFEAKLRGRENLFYILLNHKSSIFAYDFDSTVCEYLPSGMTYSQNVETKEEKLRIRAIEEDILSRVGLSFEEVEYIRSKVLFLKFLENKNIPKILKYFRHIIKWKLKLLLK